MNHSIKNQAKGKDLRLYMENIKENSDKKSQRRDNEDLSI